MKRLHRILSGLTASVTALMLLGTAMPAVSAAGTANGVTPAAEQEPVVTTSPYYPEHSPWVTDEYGHQYPAGTNALWECRLEIKEYPQTSFAVGEEFNTDGLKVFLIEQRRFNQKDYDVTPVLNIETDYDPDTEGTYTVWLSTDYQNGEAYTDDVITYEVTVSNTVTTMSTEASGTVTGFTETTATTAATQITQLTNISVSTTGTHNTTGDAYGGSSGTRLTTTMIELEPVNLEVGDSIVVDVCEDPDQVLSVTYARDLNPGLISNVGYEYSECYVRVYFHALKTGATTVEVLLCDGRTFLIPVIISNQGAVTTAVTMYVGEEVTVPVFTIPYGVEVNDVSIYGDSCINLNRNRMEYDELARTLNMHITADAPGQADIIVTLSSGTTFVFHITAFARLTAITMMQTVMYVGDESDIQFTCPTDPISGQLATDVAPQPRTTGEVVQCKYNGIETVCGCPVFSFHLTALKEGECGINFWLNGGYIASFEYLVLDASLRPETTTTTSITRPDVTDETTTVSSLTTTTAVSSTTPHSDSSASGTDGVLIRGDANGNGIVELKDAVLLAKAIAGIESLSASGARSCDLDGKAGLGEGDLSRMIRYFAGLIQNL